MDTKTGSKNKKNSKATLIVSLACTVVALAMTISGFLPIYETNKGGKVGIGTFISMLFDGMGLAEGLIETLMMLILMYCLPQAVAIVWSAIPKKWAAVVGTVYATLLAAWSFGLYILSSSPTLNETRTFLLGPLVFRNYASLLLLVLSVAKIVTTSKDKKKAKQTTGQS